MPEGGDDMGTRGPVPKRSDKRRRRNADSAVDTIEIPADAEPVEAPPLGFTTNAIAMEWYESLASSGQARYFEPSDWQAARVVTQELGRMLNYGKPSGQLFTALWSAMGDLLSTEAARRRVRMEIDRSQPAEGEDADVIELYKGLGL
ncbi:hypothetical protein BKA00_007420 [Actinomadura coerulea]|uniref:Terminase small subunit n=1 Tax=Actinomadura coerulea TaxID=46159 RepID=A0A7X0G6U2_9ACTN|nr:hypothetical protein [Actinomadura coerulea]MBB6400506.1 hypothetical protein [Actinomadura coerulea]GGQ07729.1 hypothetical protein GCM10010187_24720 [Actinomadura coerulea]